MIQPVRRWLMLLITLFYLNSVVFAQDLNPASDDGYSGGAPQGDAAGEEPPPPPGDPLDVPLDGGLSILIAAAAGYGARKAHEHHREQKKKREK